MLILNYENLKIITIILEIHKETIENKIIKFN